MSKELRFESKKRSGSQVGVGDEWGQVSTTLSAANEGRKDYEKKKNHIFLTLENIAFAYLDNRL